MRRSGCSTVCSGSAKPTTAQLVDGDPKGRDDDTDIHPFAVPPGRIRCADDETRLPFNVKRGYPNRSIRDGRARYSNAPIVRRLGPSQCSPGALSGDQRARQVVIESIRDPYRRSHPSTFGEHGRKEALHRFVREWRLRLAPESQVLGGRPRLPARVRVTLEELAEHLGIS